MVGQSSIGGTELQVIKIANGFGRLGFAVHLIVIGNNGPINQVCAEYNLDVVTFPILHGSVLKRMKGCFSLLMHLATKRIDLIYAFLPNCIIVSALFKILLFNKFLLLAGARGVPSKRAWLIEIVHRFALKQSDLVIANSRFLKQYYIETYKLSVDSIFQISNIVNLEVPIANVCSNTAKVAVISNFMPYKGHSLLLEVLSNSDVTCQFIFFGNGSDETIEFLNLSIDNLGLKNRITIVSNTSKIDEMLAECIFAVHPSKKESMSNAILEEMAAGLPVIAFDIGGNSELITHGVNGFLITPFNLEDMAMCIEKLTRDDTLRFEFGSESRKLAESFSAHKSLEKYAEVVAHLSKSRKSRRC